MKIHIGTKICICKTAEMKHQVGTTCGSSLLRNIFKENVLQGHISLSSFGFHFALWTLWWVSLKCADELEVVIPEYLLDIGETHQSVGVWDRHWVVWKVRVLASGSCLYPAPTASCTTKVVRVTSPKAQSQKRGLTPMDQSAHPGSLPAGPNEGPASWVGLGRLWLILVHA